MNPRLMLILEYFLILAGLIAYSLGYLPLPILPLLVVAWASLRIRHLRWWDVGLRRPEHWLATIGLSLLVGIGYQALDVLLIAPLLQKLIGQAVDLSQFNLIRGNFLALILAMLVSWTEAAFLEEMFFRGYLFNRLRELFTKPRLGLIIAVLVNSLIFGAAHGYQGITGVLDTFLAGLLLSGLYLLAKRNLWLPILTHGIIDTTGFLMIYISLGV